MTRKSLHFDSPKSIVSAPDPTFPPTVAFQQPLITVLVGANVENIVFWTSPQSGAYTSLTSTLPTLTEVSPDTAASGTATWTKSNVQLADNGTVQVDIVDSGGTDSDTFALVVEAEPTISFDNASVTVEEGGTGLNTLVWGDADASVQKPIASIVADTGTISAISNTTLAAGTAAWTLPNALATDAGTITATITDADGHIAEATFTLTVDPLPTGSPTVTTAAQHFIEVPFGPTQLTFTVQDNETTPGNPYTAFRIFDSGGTDQSGSGVFSPLPGNVLTSAPQVITWSTSTAFTLTEDGTIWTIEAEDGDNLLGQATTEIVLAHVDPLKDLVGHPVQRASSWALSQATTTTTPSGDPLRTLSGHPSPATSDWGITNGSWSNDATNGGTTWVTSTVTGYQGGVMLDVKNSLTSFRKVVGTIEGGGYRARCRVHLKDFNQAVRLRWWNDTTLMSDYSWPGQYTTGDFASATELNVISELISGSPGDTLTLELWTECYDVAGQTIKASLTDSEKAFLVQMDMEYDPVAPAVPGGTELFYWEAAVTPPSKAIYDAAYAALPTDGVTGRPHPNANIDGPSVAGTGRFQFPINFEIPIMNGDGTLLCDRKIPNNAGSNGHNMLRARMLNNEQYVESSAYTKPNQLFEVEFKIDITGRVDAIGEFRYMAWGIVWQGHAGNYPPDWSGNPQLALQIDDQKVPGGVWQTVNEQVVTGSSVSAPERRWRMWVRGHTDVDPTTTPADDYNSRIAYDLGTVWSGPHHFKIQYRANYTGVNTLFKLWHNDKLEIDVTNIPIGLNYSALGKPGNQSFQHTFGAYGWGITGSQDPSDLTNGRPDMDYKLFSIRGQ